MNLPLERVYCRDLEQINIEKKYSKYLADFSKKEFEQEFLLSEERIDEVFHIFSSFIEDMLFDRTPVIYAQTQRMLKFYRNHLRRRQAQVLFMQVEGKEEEVPELLEKIKELKERSP